MHTNAHIVAIVEHLALTERKSGDLIVGPPVLPVCYSNYVV